MSHIIHIVNVLTKSAPLGTLGLPSGDHWVRFHVEGDTISFEVAGSLPKTNEQPVSPATQQKPTKFVQKWGSTASKIEDVNDSWLTHINEKHLK